MVTQAKQSLSEWLAMFDGTSAIPIHNDEALSYHEGCPEAKAEALDLDIRLPEPHQLFIDIDSEEQWLEFRRLFTLFNRGRIQPWTYIYSPSPSGKPFHYHVIVDIKRDVESDTERVLLQALLGSDPVREVLAYKCTEEDVTGSCFFEKRGVQPGFTSMHAGEVLRAAQ